MDALNPQRLLRLVICLALCFGSAFAVADGADALRFPGPSDHLVKFMAFGAMSFLAIYICRGCAVLQRVLRRADALQMLRVHAVSIAAGVVHNQTLSNLAKHAEPRDSMGAAGGSTEEEAAVSIAVERASPEPAIADHFVFRCKAVRFGLGHVFHTAFIPKGAEGDNGEGVWAGA